MGKKELVAKYPGLVGLACRLHNLLGVRVRGRKKGNQIIAPRALVKNTRFQFSGTGNRVIIGDFTRLNNVTFHISGNNNLVEIGPWCTMVGGSVWMEDASNLVRVGEHTRFLGDTHLAAIEGTSITIGRECLFSSAIQFRTGDSHSILDMEGRRINPSRDIVIGDHVWVGNGVVCLKGTRIASNCIIGTRALVSGQFRDENCAIAGVPAKVIRREVNWDIRRLPVEQTEE